MSVRRETEDAPKSVVAKIPLFPKLLIAILAGAMVAAAAAQALEILHH